MEELDSTKLRFVIYARKSSEDSEKQVRSIDDQVAECMELAKDKNLHITEVITEHKSAKLPDKRPEFKRMMTLVNSKKIDGILAWHPDRLARNMVEAGRVIYKLDTGALKDLRFVSHQFSNDANGKLLLGMLFVFAKHYSDDLSAKVKRGVRHSFAEGKSAGTPKWGYIRRENGVYEPDGMNYDLIREAWLMRGRGETLENIAAYLRLHNFTRYYYREDKHIAPKTLNSNVNKLFYDTFYMGILNQAGTSTDLREVMGFKPMLTEEEFIAAQQYNKISRRGPRRGGNAMFLPLRKLVYCGHCDVNKPMSVYASTGRNAKYLYYRCENKDCTRTQKAVRGIVVFNEINRVIKQVQDRLSAEAYSEYIKEVKGLTKNGKTEARSEIARNKVLKANYERQQNERFSSIAKVKDKTALVRLNAEIEELSEQIIELDDQIQKAQRLIDKSNLPYITPDEFEAEMKLLAKKLEKGSAVRKDTIVRNMFSHLHINNEKALSVIWKEPFATLVHASGLQTGGGGRT